MYPPPQGDVVVNDRSRPVSGEYEPKFGLDFIRFQMKQNAVPPPFSYEYVLQDGKMPMLAEYHAVERNSAAGIVRSASTRSASYARTARRPALVNRSSSYNSHDKSGHKEASKSSGLLASESTAERFKRTFSLHSPRNSTFVSRQSSKASRAERSVASQQPSRHASHVSRRRGVSIASPTHSTRYTTPPSESRVPSLILPTPSSSPEPTSTASSSPQKPPMSFGLPEHNVQTASSRPFSWAHHDDEILDDEYDDLAFLQESGMGRLGPRVRAQKQFRKSKAFELLGIANKTNEQTRKAAPSGESSSRPSHASFDRDRASRDSSRRTSKDNRHGMWNQSIKPHASQQIAPWTSPMVSSGGDNTTKPLQQRSNALDPVLGFMRRQKETLESRPKSIVVHKFRASSQQDRYSAPYNLQPKPESPIHAITRGSLDLAAPQPLPASVAKVSRFIEHLDADARQSHHPTSQQHSSPAAPFLEIRTSSDPDLIAPAPRRATSPLPAALRSPLGSSIPQLTITRPAGQAKNARLSATLQRNSTADGVRRSVSMRESSSGPWAAVVCTAEARPIVATGHAKIVLKE